MSSRVTRSALPGLAAVVCFGLAFGFVEAAVVVYLRHLLKTGPEYVIGSYRVLLDLKVISFVSPAHPPLVSRDITTTEVAREVATIVMLLAVGLLAGRTWVQRLAAFLIAFACWDLSYYVYLKVLIGWPAGLMTRDVYFLIPVVWIGPVITPVLVSCALLAGGVAVYLRPARRRARTVRRRSPARASSPASV